ncbi:MAG: CHRD domain-containing protein [Gammaproteobacteria bacterium]|nr:MAG: CHRD domain-containing protein [Gammaproteobacteria bacterium]
MTGPIFSGAGRVSCPLAEEESPAVAKASVPISGSRRMARPDVSMIVTLPSLRKSGLSYSIGFAAMGVPPARFTVPERRFSRNRMAEMRHFMNPAGQSGAFRQAANRVIRARMRGVKQGVEQFLAGRFLPFPAGLLRCNLLRLLRPPDGRHGQRRERMHTRNLLAALVLAGAVVASPAVAHAAKLAATLTGAEQTGGGDTDGSGAFAAEIDPDSGDLCYTLTVKNIAPATMAHIHKGAAGSDGDVVVTLNVTGTDGDECSAVQHELAKEIVANPAGYYVNVHNADFPKGAIRGQLVKTAD